MKKLILFLAFALSLSNIKAQGGEPYLGQILYVAFNYAPRNWAECNGQILQISQYSALYSLLGTQYGGNGSTTFALPNLQGRVLVNSGQGPALSNYVNGQTGGVETETLTITEMPKHTHVLSASTSEGDTEIPTGNVYANTKKLDKEYSSLASDTTMKSSMISNTGGNLPHENRPPYLALKCIISLTGVYPQRP